MTATAPYPGHPRTTRHLFHDVTKSQKLWAARRARGMDSAFTDSSAVRAHLERLHAWGLGDSTIARAAGLTHTTVCNIRTGAYPRCLRTVAAALLAADHHPRPAQLCVLSVGARRRVEALQVMGWTAAALAPHVNGATPQALSSCVRGRTMTYRNWLAIEAAYAALSHVPGPSAIARSRALAAGRAAPLAWEGRDIDHPDAQPWRPGTADRRVDRTVDVVAVERALSGERHVTVSAAERLAGYAEAVARGWTPRHLADRTGWPFEGCDRGMSRARLAARTAVAVAS